jgi:hypothetical protein
MSYSLKDPSNQFGWYEKIRILVVNGAFGPIGSLGIKRVQCRNSWFTCNEKGWSPKSIPTKCEKVVDIWELLEVCHVSCHIATMSNVLIAILSFGCNL